MNHPKPTTLHEFWTPAFLTRPTPDFSHIVTPTAPDAALEKDPIDENDQVVYATGWAGSTLKL